MDDSIKIINIMLNPSLIFMFLWLYLYVKCTHTNSESGPNMQIYKWYYLSKLNWNTIYVKTADLLIFVMTF